MCSSRGSCSHLQGAGGAGSGPGKQFPQRPLAAASRICSKSKAQMPGEATGSFSLQKVLDSWLVQRQACWSSVGGFERAAEGRSRSQKNSVSRGQRAWGPPEGIRHSFCCDCCHRCSGAFAIVFLFSSFLSVPFCISLMGWAFPQSLACLPASPALLYPHPHLHRQLKGLKVHLKAGTSTFSRDLHPLRRSRVPLQSLTQAAMGGPVSLERAPPSPLIELPVQVEAGQG